MGLKELKAAGGRAEQLMAFGLEINRVGNTWGPTYGALRTQAGN